MTETCTSAPCWYCCICVICVMICGGDKLSSILYCKKSHQLCLISLKWNVIYWHQAAIISTSCYCNNGTNDYEKRGTHSDTFKDNYRLAQQFPSALWSILSSFGSFVLVFTGRKLYCFQFHSHHWFFFPAAEDRYFQQKFKKKPEYPTSDVWFPL